MAKKTPAAVREYLRAIGAKGGKAAAGRGAKVRFEAMTPQERRALAKKAARARWAKKRAAPGNSRRASGFRPSPAPR